MRYVLVEVESPSEAERLMQQLDDSDAFPTSQVVGLFSKASSLCQCKPWQERHPGEPERSMRGGRWRWWVCPDCRLPKRMGTQNLYNLLDGGGTRGGGWKDKRLGRSLGYLSIYIAVRWVQVGDRVTAFRAAVREEAAPDLEIQEGSDQP